MGTKHLNGVYIIFSDIQGSYTFLERFLDATRKMKKEGFICLGDIVDKLDDYSDNRCISAVRKKARFTVKGNHEDKKFDRTKIEKGNIDFINGLPTILDLGNVLLFHSSINQEHKRLKSDEEIKEELILISQRFPDVRFGLFGHTHKKGAYSLINSHVKPFYEKEIRLNPDELNLVNPGAIGVRYGLEKTFTRINFDNGELRFFTLEEAEAMAYRAEVVNSFDFRWMPTLNEDSYPWFLQYFKADAPILEEKERKDSCLSDLADRLKDINIGFLERSSVSRRRKYLEVYSHGLAEEIEKIREPIKDLFDTKDPIKSREEFLRLSRKKI